MENPAHKNRNARNDFGGAVTHVEVNAKRRGATINPPNRFEKVHYEPDPDFENEKRCDADQHSLPIIQTELYRDETKGIISENDSPDLHFRYSINPYRGCAHGCTYCYARPYHELIGWNAGLDFESKLVYKHNAANLLREFLSKPGWNAEPIMLSGVTDCYQPIERELGITRQCLEVMLETRQPVQLISKSKLILRDIDLIGELARRRLVQAAVAITSLNPKISHAMEPRATHPKVRLEMIETLTKAGVPVVGLISPVVPGLTDSEIPAILKAVKSAGAVCAGYTLLRLPGAVRLVFLDWLRKTFPERAPMVESLVLDIRGGKWNDARFHSRFKGTGKISEQISRMFKLFRRRCGLDKPMPPLDSSQFCPPADSAGQQWLF